ncbi:hypothetical protein PoB_004351000 [Plakobranchus ocellatus]|uniref:Uncharacterized protein n=1 Tax=Plakobranchus ocellatus TaxID=259542 RepID=A0AAV4B8V2_9GAST|nr:hypothetical protein PoB_004351000 [Plakobranchus ocellatus]
MVKRLTDPDRKSFHNVRLPGGLVARVTQGNTLGKSFLNVTLETGTIVTCLISTTMELLRNNELKEICRSEASPKEDARLKALERRK